MTVPAADLYLLAAHGDVLTGRALGGEVAAEVRKHVKPGAALVLSFSGVRVASLPFMDEMLGQLQRELADHPESMLVVHGLNASVREHVKTVLDGRKMVLALLSRRGISLLGGDGDLRKLMRAVQKLDLEFSADELARELPRQGALIERGVAALVAAGALGGRRRTRRLRRPPSDRLLQLVA